MLLLFLTNLTVRAKEIQDSQYRIEAKLDKLLAKKKPVKSSSSTTEYGTSFLKAWGLYPKRVGANPKRSANSAFRARAKEHHNPYTAVREMISGAQEYAKFCDATSKTNTEFVMMASTFFGPDKHYLTDFSIPDTMPRNNDDLIAWADCKGYRQPAPGESFAVYRRALEELHNE